MHFSTGRKTTIGTAVVVLAMGFSSLVVLSSPALADPVSCVQGTQVSGIVCELTVLSGTGTFSPDSSMQQLQALLVGGGGSSAAGYGGGGGSVMVHNFSDTSSDIDYSVGGAGNVSSATQNSTPYTASAGTDGDTNIGGGSSGTNSGYIPSGGFMMIGGGGGAGGVGAQYNGGDGISPGFIANSASPFTFDSTPYGGGGAAADGSSAGVATAGGGSVTFLAGNQVSVAATPNSGGGGGGGTALLPNAGASGIVVFRWEQLAPVTYTGSFDLGGHGTAIDSQVVTRGDLVIQPADPTASGFAFDGWYTDVDVSIPADFSTPMSADTVFYASWEGNAVTGSFNLGGHGAAIESQSVSVGQVITAPEPPAADGFTFGGWFTDDALQDAADFSASIEADTVFFAKWTAIVPIVTGSFNLGGHGAAIEQQAVNSGDLLTRPADPSADGFTFGGWFTDADLTIAADFGIPITADATLYAAWSAVVADPATATLPITGAVVSPLLVPLGIVVVLLGGGLLFWSARRARLRRK